MVTSTRVFQHKGLILRKTTTDGVDFYEKQVIVDVRPNSISVNDYVEQLLACAEELTDAVVDSEGWEEYGSTIISVTVEGWVPATEDEITTTVEGQKAQAKAAEDLQIERLRASRPELFLI